MAPRFALPGLATVAAAELELAMKLKDAEICLAAYDIHE